MATPFKDCYTWAPFRNYNIIGSTDPPLGTRRLGATLRNFVVRGTRLYNYKLRPNFRNYMDPIVLEIVVIGPPLEIMIRGPTFKNGERLKFHKKVTELINAGGWARICKDKFEHFKIPECQNFPSFT